MLPIHSYSLTLVSHWRKVGHMPTSTPITGKRTEVIEALPWAACPRPEKHWEPVNNPYWPPSLLTENADTRGGRRCWRSYRQGNITQFCKNEVHPWSAVLNNKAECSEWGFHVLAANENNHTCLEIWILFFIRMLKGEHPSMQPLFLGTHRTNLKEKLKDRKL